MNNIEAKHAKDCKDRGQASASSITQPTLLLFC